MPDPRPRGEDELKIGDLERQAGVPRSTIQHYVRLGLLPPPRRLGPKLFLFDGKHLEALRRVRDLREREQLSLAEIRARLRSRASWPLPASEAPRERPRGPDASSDPRRTAILEVATRMFTRHGYENVRLADVGRELGLSKAALYRYFDGKEALFVECIDRIRLLVVPQQAREAGRRVTDPGQRASMRISAVLRNFESYRMLTHLLVSVANDRNQELAAKARAAFHRMVTDVVPELRGAVQAGFYRDGDLELDAYVFWGALMGAGDFMSFVRRDPVDQVARTLTELFALGTQAPRA